MPRDPNTKLILQCNISIWRKIEIILLTLFNLILLNSILVWFMSKENNYVTIVMPLLVENSVIVIFYVIFWCAMRKLLITNYFGKKFFFPIKRTQGVNNCFKLLISFVFTTAVSRLNQNKKKRKNISWN